MEILFISINGLLARSGAASSVTLRAFSLAQRSVSAGSADGAPHLLSRLRQARESTRRIVVMGKTRKRSCWREERRIAMAAQR